MKSYQATKVDGFMALLQDRIQLGCTIPVFVRQLTQCVGIVF